MMQPLEKAENKPQKRISTGIEIFDELLGGGYDNDIITTVYGPSGSGKTNICIISSLAVSNSGKKVIYIDTEGGFSIERLRQICGNDTGALERIFLIKPTNFKEQKEVFEKLKDYVKDDVGLIVVDTISMLYRLEKGKEETIAEINQELGKQICFLTEIARKKNSPVLISNQVYSDFDNRERVKIVGGDILKYGSKCLVELQTGHKGLRKAILKKHRNMPEDKEILFRIEDKGILKIEP